MGKHSLSLLVHVVVLTAYNHKKLEMVLLGVSCAGYDERAKQRQRHFLTHAICERMT
jgi:hypothetical protein